MLDYPAARAVALVAATGSFEAAARALHVTPSAVSQRVRQLEERLGAVLIERGLPCRATEQGAWICRHMERIGLLEAELRARLPGFAAGGPGERVTLPIAANADSLGTWLPGALAEFAATSEHLLGIIVEDEGETAEWLRRGRVLAAVSALAKPVQGCEVHPLGRLRYRATASPDFAARHFADGVSPETLGAAPGLRFDRADRLQHAWTLRAFGREIDYPAHWLPSTQGFLDACLAGMAWALNPAALVEGPLASGRLVELLPGVEVDVPLFWQINRLAADPLGALTRAVRAAAARALG